MPSITGILEGGSSKDRCKDREGYFSYKFISFTSKFLQLLFIVVFLRDKRTFKNVLSPSPFLEKLNIKRQKEVSNNLFPCLVFLQCYMGVSHNNT